VAGIAGEALRVTAIARERSGLYLLGMKKPSSMHVLAASVWLLSCSGQGEGKYDLSEGRLTGAIDGSCANIVKCGTKNYPSARSCSEDTKLRWGVFYESKSPACRDALLTRFECTARAPCSTVFAGACDAEAEAEDDICNGNGTTGSGSTSNSDAAGAASFYGAVEVLKMPPFDVRDLKDLPSYIQAGDLDGDGAEDIIVGLGSTKPLQRRVVLLSSRGGFSAEPVELDCAAGKCDRAALLIDANGDGKNDIVDVYGTGKINTPPESYIRVYLNDGSGGFRPPVITTVPFDDAWRTLNLVLPNGRDVYLRSSMTPECYDALKATLATNSCVRDTDCSNGDRCTGAIDGKSHCVPECHHVAAYRADEGGKFSQVWDLALKHDYGSAPVQVVDQNGDGKMDVLASGNATAETNQLWLGQEQGFSAAMPYPSLIPQTFVDVDGDGVLDAHNHREIYFREASGAQGTAVSLKAPGNGGSPTWMHTFEHGGARHFVHQVGTGSDLSEIQLYRIDNRKPVFLHRVQVEDSSVDGVVAGDFDKDGLLEIAFLPDAPSGVTHLEFSK
jgi:hypothetical protein